MTALISPNLICPISRELFEDPVTVPCCGRSISRQYLILALDNNRSCPLCRGNLDNFDPVNAAPARDLIDLVEEVKIKLSPNTVEPLDQWKATLTILEDDRSFIQRKIGRLQFSNDKIKFKNLLIPVIDRSGSMTGDPIRQVCYSLKRLVDLTYNNPNITTNVITYDDSANSHLIDISNPKIIYENKFNSLGGGGGTSFSSAFNEIVRVADKYANNSDYVSMTIIFLTDGEDSSVRKELRHTLVTAFKNNIKQTWKKNFVIHSIGFGSSHDFDFLNMLRCVGTEEGAYRYANPAEDNDSLSNKINSILDVVAQSSSMPIKIITSGDNLQIIGSQISSNGKFWVNIKSDWIQNTPIEITFSVDNNPELSLIVEVNKSVDLWTIWYSKLIDDIANELIIISDGYSSNSIVSSTSGALARNVHIELLTRRCNAILSRIDPAYNTNDNSVNYHRLTSLMSTLDTIRKDGHVDKQKLNDIKFEGQFATKSSTQLPLSQPILQSVPVVPKLVSKKQSQWIIIEQVRCKRLVSKKNCESCLTVLARGKNQDFINLIKSNRYDVAGIRQNGSNCLHLAVSIGRIQIARSLISADIFDINTVNDDGQTALDLAALYGYWHMFDLIIENGGSIKYNPQLLLRTCISRKYTNIAERLLQHSLAVVTDDMLDNVPTAEGLEWLNAHSNADLPLETAILKGAVDIVMKKIPDAQPISWNGLNEIFTKSTDNYLKIVNELLLQHKAKAHEILTINDDITFPLFIASEKGSLPMVKLLLRFLNKDEINFRNKKGTTCLWISSCNRHIDIVDELLNAGADPNIPNFRGDSALICCCQKGSANIVQLLLQAGIDPNIFNPERDNPVLICCRVGQAGILELLLKKILTENPSSNILTYYAQVDGFPPLLASTELNRVDCIKVCVAFGADLEWKTKDDNPIIPGATALHLACHYGRLEAAQTLCQLGANICSQTSVGGYTPLHIAIKSGHINLVRYLLSQNKDSLSIIDDDGRLPEYYASMQGRENIKDEFFTNKLNLLFDQIVFDTSGEAANVLVKYGQSLGCYEYSEFIQSNLGQGTTLLSLALMYRNKTLVQALESIGTSIDIRDDYGVTPDFWRSYIFGTEPILESTKQQLSTIKVISNQNIHNRMLTDLSTPVNYSNTNIKQLEFKKKMSQGYNIKKHNDIAIFRKSKSFITKINNASNPPILGFLEKLKNNKVFPEGKDCLEQILWESRIHIVKLIASGETVLSPLHMMAIYLYTGNTTVFTQVNSSLIDYNDKNIWNPFIICLYQSISNLPSLIGEVYRSVDCDFVSSVCEIGTKIMWNTFSIATKDWHTPSELIKEQKGIVFIIKSKTGRDISRYSRTPANSEIIFLPGTAFMITAIYKPNIIALGQSNIRTTTFVATENDIQKAVERKASIIIEIDEITSE